MTQLPHYLSYAELASFPSLARIAVIGAGLAGCATVYALTQRGYQVDLYDKNADIAQETSGNKLGILKPYYTADENVSDRFHSGGFQRTHAFITQHHIDHLSCGAVQLLSPKEIMRYRNIIDKRKEVELTWLEPSQLTLLLGMPSDKSAVYYPSAMAVSPKAVCQAFLALSGSRVRTYFNHEMQAMKRSQHQWQLQFSDHKAEYDVVILCGGYPLIHHYLPKLPVFPAYGQVSYLEPSYHNQTIVMEKGYLLPPSDGVQVIGATFRDNADLDPSVRDSDDAENIDLITEMMGASPQGKVMGARVGLRCVTSDHIPMVGAVADYEGYTTQFAEILGYGKRSDLVPHYQHGLYINSGYGSKGLCSCLYASEIVADMIAGNIEHYDDKVIQALHPLRFWARELKRRLSE